ncbi:MAG: hypothetical protein BM564_09490 [Bacteroidetes bacterium MedPE-SWsnd-G2]|mgnify:CR=1 FL=1|nr:MAG: hypothetical protein BM564_09490 [Bacteroidetes bacterium MedPE-SWsnd-G2]
MKPKILCIGDSITRGYEVNIDQSYPSLLGMYLDLPVINLGVNGDTTAGMLSRIEAALKFHKPEIVLVLGGVNDLTLKSKPNVVFSNLVNMYRIIKHYNAIPVPCEILNVVSEDQIISKSSLFLAHKKVQKRIQKLNKKIRAFADYDNLAVVSFAGNFTSKMYMDDGLHPNVLGYKTMAETASICLKELLLK